MTGAPAPDPREADMVEHDCAEYGHVWAGGECVVCGEERELEDA